MPGIRLCEMCGAPALVRRYPTRTCSQLCAHKLTWRNKERRPISRDCEICGVFMLLTGRKEKRTCSRKCADVLAARSRKPATVIIDHEGYQRLRGKRVHVIVAERALGKPLPAGARVHHVNEIKTDNTNSNLVICQDDAYHQLLHYRARAFDATGHADWLKCGYCRGWSDPSNPDLQHYSRPNLTHKVWHKTCYLSYAEEYKPRRLELERIRNGRTL